MTDIDTSPEAVERLAARMGFTTAADTIYSPAVVRDDCHDVAATLRALSARLMEAKASEDRAWAAAWSAQREKAAWAVQANRGEDRLIDQLHEAVAERDRLREALTPALAAWASVDGLAHRQGDRVVSAWAQYVGLYDAMNRLRAALAGGEA